MIKFISRYYYRGLREYRILSEISEGGMSKVYKALSRLTGDIAAIKILFPRCTQKRRFLEKAFREKHVESDIVASLIHPAVIRTYSCGRVKNQDFFVMEYVDGPNMKNVIYSQPELLEENKTKIILQIADGLRYIHSKGIIHRDICPKNILLTPGGQVKIIDFGLAVAEYGKYRAQGERSGTPSYMAPEQIRSFEPDARADIYSFGVTMYEILAGKALFSGGDDNLRMQNHLNADGTALHKTVPGISEWLAMIIQKCIQKNPADRYDSMDSLAADLNSVFSEEAG